MKLQHYSHSKRGEPFGHLGSREALFPPEEGNEAVKDVLRHILEDEKKNGIPRF